MNTTMNTINPDVAGVLQVMAMVSSLLVCGSALSAPYVIQPSGQKLEGTAIRANKDGQIVLTTADGQLTFPKGTKAFADPPADYPRAVQMVQQGQFAPAIQILTKVVDEYRFLEWDNKARRSLASAYVGKGDFKSAVGVYEELFASVPESRKEEDVQGGYIRAVGGMGDDAKLAPLLQESIASGPRKAAAVAQVVRGNMKLARGDVQGALYDFLRTAEFFREEAAVQPEAVYRAGECLEKLGDPRAEEFFARVAKDYAQSPFAAKARMRSLPAASKPGR